MPHLGKGNACQHPPPIVLIAQSYHRDIQAMGVVVNLFVYICTLFTRKLVQAYEMNIALIHILLDLYHFR